MNRVLLGFTGLNRVLLGFTRFYLVVPRWNGFYWVLPGFTGFYRVLPGFTSHLSSSEAVNILSPALGATPAATGCWSPPFNNSCPSGASHFHSLPLFFLVVVFHLFFSFSFWFVCFFVLSLSLSLSSPCFIVPSALLLSFHQTSAFFLLLRLFFTGFLLSFLSLTLCL